MTRQHELDERHSVKLCTDTPRLNCSYEKRRFLLGHRYSFLTGETATPGKRKRSLAEGESSSFTGSVASRRRCRRRCQRQQSASEVLVAGANSSGGGHGAGRPEAGRPEAGAGAVWAGAAGTGATGVASGAGGAGRPSPAAPISGMNGLKNGRLVPPPGHLDAPESRADVGASEFAAAVPITSTFAVASCGSNRFASQVRRRRRYGKLSRKGTLPLSSKSSVSRHPFPTRSRKPYCWGSIGT